MMPLTMAEVGEENIIKKIGGKQEVKLHLETLGFVIGGAVTVMNTISGNGIVNVKDSRLATYSFLVFNLLCLLFSCICCLSSAIVRRQNANTV